MYFNGIVTRSTVVITTKPITPEYFFDLVEKYSVTSFLTTGNHITNQLKSESIAYRNFPSVRSVSATSSRVSHGALKQYQNLFPNGTIRHSYAMTEVAGMVACNSPPIDSGSVGRLASGLKIKIVDSNGKRLGVDEKGEIRLKHSMNILGYFNNKEANDAAFDAEGFYRTGDFGWFDETGNLFVQDRLVDMIKVDSHHISPSEIEEVLITLPSIKAVCITAVTGLEGLELPAAAIVRKEGYEITKETVNEIMKRAFDDDRQLRGGIYFVDDLQYTPSGKILRRAVKETLEQLFRKQRGTH